MFLTRVKELIKSHGITKNKLLVDVGINTSAFTNWENRNTVPSGEVIAKIADYFHVSTDYLLGRTDDPRPLDKKEPTPASEDGPSETAQVFMPLVDKLTPDQQQLLLAQLQAWTGQNERPSPAAPGSGGGKAPGSDS